MGSGNMQMGAIIQVRQTRFCLEMQQLFCDELVEQPRLKRVCLFQKILKLTAEDVKSILRCTLLKHLGRRRLLWDFCELPIDLVPDEEV